MASALNPFVWDRPLDDPSKIVGMDAFAHQVALTLKGQKKRCWSSADEYCGEDDLHFSQLALELSNSSR